MTITWLTPKLRKGGNEGESRARVWKEPGVSDKVESRGFGSTFQFYGNSERGSRKGNLCGSIRKGEKHRPEKQ